LKRLHVAQLSQRLERTVAPSKELGRRCSSSNRTGKNSCGTRQ
jgi:hypothetical protein